MKRQKAINIPTDQLMAILAGRFRRQALIWTASGAAHGALLLLTMMVALIGHLDVPVVVQEAQLVQVEERITLDARRQDCSVTGLPTPEVIYTPEVRPDVREDTGPDVDHNAWAPELAEVPSPAPGNVGFMGGKRRAKAAPSNTTGAGLYDSRTTEGRAAAVKKYGGSDASERAVDLGLKWLAQTQNADGSWSSFSRVKHDSKDNVQLAESGLAVLAFLAAGHTEKHGFYKDTVAKGLQYIMERQREDGGIVFEHYIPPPPDFSGLHGMGLVRARNEYKARQVDPEGYSHAICGMALAEAYGMSKGKTGGAAQKAVNYSVFGHQYLEHGQYSGWRYKPKDPNPDTSVTGWFIMQLKSAKMSGLTVPGQGWDGAKRYMDNVTYTKGNDYNTIGGVSYQDNLGVGEFVARPVMTAVGLTAHQFLGKARGDVAVLGAARQVVQMPGKFLAAHDIYGIYYGTIGMHQFGGDLWPIWNEGFRDPLIGRQEADGSWFGDVSGGRTYLTAMAVLSLEVYYRYLPMYQEMEPSVDRPARQVNPRVEKVVGADGKVQKVVTYEHR